MVDPVAGPGAARRPRIGLTFGHFHLLQFVTRTPFGELLFARHPALQEAVIVERFDPSRWASAESADAFVARAQGACLPIHTTLQAILDAGTIEGVPFCVREAIDGEPLSYFVGRLGPVPPTLAALYSSRLVEAASALHEKGTVHGAINPLFALLTPVIGVSGEPETATGAATRLAGAASFPIPPALNDPPLRRSDSSGSASCAGTISGRYPCRHTTGSVSGPSRTTF